MTSVFFSEIAIAVCGEHVGTANDGAVCTGFAPMPPKIHGEHVCTATSVCSHFIGWRQEWNPHCGSKLGFMEGFGDHSTPTPTQQLLTALGQLVGAPSESLPTRDRTQLLAKKSRGDKLPLSTHIKKKQGKLFKMIVHM